MAGTTDVGVTDPDHHGVRLVEQGCALHLLQTGATATATSKARYPWDGGAVSDCGDAVNPSLGAWPRHPCRGHPALRHRPTSDRFRWLLVGVDLGRHGRSTPCVDGNCQISKYMWGQIRFPSENGSDPKSRSNRPQESVEGGVGPVAGVSAAWMPRPSPQGWVYGVSRNRTHPAYPQEARFCFGCCCCCCSSSQRVQGAALPTNPLLRRFVARVTLDPALH